MADWPSDVADLADALEVDRFIVSGHSSGGPYGLVCAARLPERVIAGLAVGGVTDMAWPGAWDGYVESERQLMRLPDEAAAIAWCVQRFGADGGRFQDVSDFEFADVDNALFADEQAGKALKSVVTEAFRQGVAGYAQDIVVQGQPWPFQPEQIVVPFEIVHGELDETVPLAHSRHTSQLLPRSTLHVLAGHGHMTTLSELPMLAGVLARSVS